MTAMMMMIQAKLGMEAQPASRVNIPMLQNARGGKPCIARLTPETGFFRMGYPDSPRVTPVREVRMCQN